MSDPDSADYDIPHQHIWRANLFSGVGRTCIVCFETGTEEGEGHVADQ